MCSTSCRGHQKWVEHKVGCVVYSFERKYPEFFKTHPSFVFNSDALYDGLLNANPGFLGTPCTLILTEGAVLAVVSRGAFTDTQHTLALTRAAPGTGRGEVMRHAGSHLQTLILSPVIIQREEPMTRVQIVTRLPTQTGLYKVKGDWVMLYGGFIELNSTWLDRVSLQLTRADFWADRDLKPMRTSRISLMVRLGMAFFRAYSPDTNSKWVDACDILTLYSPIEEPRGMAKANWM